MSEGQRGLFNLPKFNLPSPGSPPGGDVRRTEGSFQSSKIQFVFAVFSPTGRCPKDRGVFSIPCLKSQKDIILMFWQQNFTDEVLKRIV